MDKVQLSRGCSAAMRRYITFKHYFITSRSESVFKIFPSMSIFLIVYVMLSHFNWEHMGSTKRSAEKQMIIVDMSHLFVYDNQRSA